MPCYLIHFSPQYKHARHYLGYADDVGPRVNAHLHGAGARLTQVATEAGCKLILARVWPDADRTEERRLKRRHNSPQLCPICAGLPVQMPLWSTLPAFVPDVEEAQL